MIGHLGRRSGLGSLLGATGRVLEGYVPADASMSAVVTRPMTSLMSLLSTCGGLPADTGEVPPAASQSALVLCSILPAAPQADEHAHISGIASEHHIVLQVFQFAAVEPVTNQDFRRVYDLAGSNSGCAIALDWP